jgi:hypothetical protein
MDYRKTFGAPWGRLLCFLTVLTGLILAGVPLIGVFTGPRGDAAWILSMIVMPLSILSGGAFFMIRRYELTEDALLVRRAGWSSRVDLSRLVSAEAVPDAMANSMRTFGNGGLFCFAGLFYNKRLGSYRVFATDPKRAVVLRFSDRVVVVTPDDPEAFVASIKAMRRLYTLQGSKFPRGNP